MSSAISPATGKGSLRELAAIPDAGVRKESLTARKSELSLETIVELANQARELLRVDARQSLGLGELAIVPLQRLLEKPPSLEAERRATLLLKTLRTPVLTPDRQRVVEAIELLEHLGTPRAVALLEEIDREALIPQLRTAARLALQRRTPMP